MAFIQVAAWHVHPQKRTSTPSWWREFRVPAFLRHPGRSIAIVTTIGAHICLWLLVGSLPTPTGESITQASSITVITLSAPIASSEAADRVADRNLFDLGAIQPPSLHPDWSITKIRVRRPIIPQAQPVQVTSPAYDPYAGAALVRRPSQRLHLVLSKGTVVSDKDFAAAPERQFDIAVLDAIRRTVLAEFPNASGDALLMVEVTKAGVVLDTELVSGTVRPEVLSALRRYLVGKDVISASILEQDRRLRLPLFVFGG